MSHTTRTIELPSGAHLTVTIDADLFDLHPADRDLVFGIVDDARRFVNDAARHVAERGASKPEPRWCAVCDAAEHCHQPGGSRYGPGHHDFVPKET